MNDAERINEVVVTFLDMIAQLLGVASNQAPLQSIDIQPLAGQIDAGMDRSTPV